MTKTIAQKNNTPVYMIKPQVQRKKVDWRDYIIPTKSKKKRRISEMVDKIVYGI